MTTSPQLAPGELDPGFANEGRLVLPYPGFTTTNGLCVAEGPDKKIYILGSSQAQDSDLTNHVSITRLLPDGTLDFSFGTHGTVHIKVPDDDLSAIPTQVFFLTDQQGRDLILACVGYDVVGVGTNTLAQLLIRLTASGELDTSFGEGGFIPLKSPFEAETRQPLTTDATLSSHSSASAACINDDKIYLITSGIDPRLGVSTGVVSCFNLDGTGDTTFGENGHAALSKVLDVRSGLNGIVVRDGKIFVCGWAIGGALLACLNLDGSFNRNFAGTGYTLLRGTAFQFESIALLSDGRPVATGFGNTQRTGLLAVYTLDGVIDPRFNHGAPIEESFNPPHQVMFLAVAIQDDKIIASGRYFVGVTPYFVAAKYQIDGGRDTNFGAGKGWSVPELPVRRAMAYGMSLQTDRKILITGSDYDGIFGRAVLAARLLNSA
ncbi:hypothetical protein PS918_04349 [Pseudomonas fluorescens]|uniref:Delta-60 repeat domain-containing protein n=1 Tax=Pseudomonas fluorescens TaxID=294 RepID=A0A5E7TVG8_PSEFL|nr:hypothetical protein [Pseudomonas fluorescens]VVQ02957.1 hypothetical protein PS918_04349 [Pseudomonas fluorescens]